jgi:bifunctional ADP-heptose synthase (sugar kinase/adenylyltransferase)
MNLVQRLLAAIREKRKRILVIGDAMTDRWVHGRVEGCQDGCEKFVATGTHVTPGGAYNACACLNHWQIDNDLYSYPADMYPIKTRFVQAGEVVWRWDDERRTVGPVPQHKYESALEMLPFSNGVLLSDYDKGFLTPELIRQVVDLCRQRGIPCVADAKREPALYAGAILKCNAEYYKPNFEQIRQTYWHWVVTYGKRPAYVQDTKGSVDIDHRSDIVCVNHVGAGDCFGAHLTLALAYGFSLVEAATLAHSAGRVYVQHPHNRPPLPSEIEADLESTQAAPGGAEKEATSQAGGGG